MGSSRLPGKILKPFYRENTLIDIILRNLHRVHDAKIIVATSTNENNDPLVSFLRSRDELVFRGSENDVLDRFIMAAESNNVEGIVRICSDNPFLDWRSVEELFDKAEKSDADYIGFRVNNTPSILTHFGFWGEYVSLCALKHVAASTSSSSPAHEHVTYHVYNHPEEYNCEWIDCPDFLNGRNDIRLTIDTEEDLDNAIKVYSALESKNPDFSLKDVVVFLDEHESIKQSMMNNIIKNTKK